jgi:hypothetical protein
MYTAFLANTSTSTHSGPVFGFLYAGLGIIVLLIVAIDAWRSNGSTGAKIGWTIFPIFCGILALILWFAVGRRRMYAPHNPPGEEPPHSYNPPMD